MDIHLLRYSCQWFEQKKLWNKLAKNCHVICEERSNYRCFCPFSKLSAQWAGCGSMAWWWLAKNLFWTSRIPPKFCPSWCSIKMTYQIFTNRINQLFYQNLGWNNVSTQSRHTESVEVWNKLNHHHAPNCKPAKKVPHDLMFCVLLLEASWSHPQVLEFCSNNSQH